jgi:S1-C subfamily serine protease
MGKRVWGTATFTAIVLVALSVIAITGTGSSGRIPRPKVTLRQVSQPPPPSQVADVVEEVLPAIVSVEVTQFLTTEDGGLQRGVGQGSGVVIDPHGIILTNYHVVERGIEVEVKVTDGQTMKGEVIGGDPDRDLAVIQVDAQDLVAIEIGKSSLLRLGDEVIAIGFPLGLGGPTVTRGIVSAIDRTIDPEGGTELTHILQTDAAINPGNSGGAMIDLNGHLVGINTAAAQAGSAENVGFAIPIDSALDVVEAILDAPPSERAWLGIAIEDFTSERAADRDMEPGGALITGIYPGSPADVSDLEAGDVIVAVEGKEVASAEELIESLTDYQAGDEVTLLIRNEEGTREVVAELELRPLTLPQS